MLVLNVRFIRDDTLQIIDDVSDDNLDAFVTLDNKFTYCVTLITVKNLLSLMDKWGVNYIEPGYPFIIVREMTKDVIHETIKAYAKDDAYWLRLHAFSEHIGIPIFEKLETEHQEFEKELREEFYDELDFELYDKLDHKLDDNLDDS